MTYLIERLAELRRYLDHLESLRPRVPDAAALQSDLSLHNDVLFSLLSVAQLVIDVAGELASRKAQRFEDDTQAIRALSVYEQFPDTLVERLALLPGFRNVVVHEYVGIDYEMVVEAMRDLESIREFARLVAALPDE